MKKAVRIGIVSIICVGLVVGYYYYVSNKNSQANPDDDTEVSQVDTVIAKDFEESYPATPREVIKWYNRIITCYYGEEYDDDELEKMADQARMLMDEDLLADNPRELYLSSLKTEIADFQNREKKIVQSRVCESNDVTYGTVDGDEFAYVTSYYFGKEGSNYDRTYQEYALRKDEQGRWKILTFHLTEGELDE